MKRSNIRILTFTRFPVPGKVKTRLIPALGPEGAACLHRRMTEHTMVVARTVREADRTGDVGITVCSTGARLWNFRTWLGQDLLYAPQPSGDLGARLRGAFKTVFRRGAGGALTIGTDVPGLSPEILHQAIDRLRDHDVVLGPAADGGYYLIGMKRLHPELFTDMDWGTERICDQTRIVIARLGLTVAELPRLNDVDRPEDLSELSSDPRFADVFNGKPLVSVIIPTLNEAQSLGRTLEHARRGERIEMIVSDGGSRDATREIAARAGAAVIHAAGGRAAQQNAGAVIAKGRILLFLHADTILPDGYACMVRRALDRPATVAGAFRLRTDASGTAMRLVEWGANIRSAVFHSPYGDQGLFMEKRIFDELSGFADLPVMEDFELVHRLRHRGSVVILHNSVVTSARRWRRLGIVHTTVINQLMVAGFIGGVPIHSLDRLYRADRNVGNNL